MVEASNRTVRVVGFVNPPFLLNCFTSYPNGCTNPGPGLDAEYIYVVLHYLMDYNVQWIRVKDRNAMYNALETGAADFSGVGAPLIEEYFGKFQNTPVYLFDAIALVVKSRSASAAADFHAVAFVETDVWFLFTITLLSIYMLSHISKYIYEVYAFEQDFSRKNRLISFLRSFRETIIYTFAFISVIFFLNLVSNIITVYLVKKDERIEYGFDNLNELGRLLLRKKCRFTMLTSIKDDPIFHHLLINPKAEDEIPWTGLFRRAFVKNPPLYVDNRFEMGKLITKSSLCYIGVDLSSLKEFYESRFCFVKVISIVKETSRLQSVFYYREEALESKLSVMSTKSLRMFYAGRAAIYSRPNKTVFCTTDYFALKSLEIGKIQDYFYFLIFTTLIAFSLLGLEKLYCKLVPKAPSQVAKHRS
ncbi:CRISPR system Cascade subunit CasA [Trichinella spiralis]|uniref:CRISPR system Cascade subunit CasA n=1 Tax=Trichinella spiralis TaxID=6334 RepID=A0ABR3KSZ9_TRISP